MNFPSIRIEGAILSPDILERLDDGSSGQKAADFGLGKGDKVKDEIARAWADAQDYWRIFSRKLETAKDNATTETRQNWIIPLLGLLRYEIEFQKSGTEIHGKNYAISHRVTSRGNTPLHIVGYNDDAGLDRKSPSSRMSAHALVQQYLNLADELYGIVTNGRVIRLLRDSSRLIKQSYVEFDLDRIFNDGLFADFAVMFRLLHATRLPHSSETAAESLLEKYHQDSLDSGARIRDGLSRAVEKAILDFGNGFLANPENTRLREAIATGRLSAENYYRNLLRLIYRLLFLMVIEERDLVFTSDVPKDIRRIYQDFYSVQRLRKLSEKRYLADKRHHDLWMALVSTFRLFEADGVGEKLGIKPLAGDLFSSRAIEEIFDARLGNDVLLGALRSLGLYEHPDSKQLIRVNYAALNVEEFGSVYEGLLEYEPVFDISGTTPAFAFKAGDERSRTGSHYTPDELVQPLIKHSLDYLIEDCVSSPHVSKGSSNGESTSDNRTPEQRLLDLRVADIACGSGHILLAAARRIATELATVRTGEEQPSPTAYRKALRDVIRNCIYGVDVNPLAVELCKVALWLEAHNPGEPLNFLDHHIKCGNAIVGYVSRDEVDKGVPEEAFARMPGDDPEFIKSIRKKNKDERREKQQVLNFTAERRGAMAGILRRWREITAMPERNPAEIEAKKAAFERFSNSGEAWELEKIASIPIAQFFIPKTPENQPKLITDAEFREYWTGERHPNGRGYAEAHVVAERQKFFHWFLEFPGVMERGGFDCILGNPPYLGGKKISGTLGDGTLAFLKDQYYGSEAGVDLVSYFLRRAYSLMRVEGFVGVIATKTISQGDTRKASLGYLIGLGALVNFAARSIRWPGTASVYVSLLCLTEGRANIRRFLGEVEVAEISSFLDDEVNADVSTLVENKNRSFQGVVPLGPGFYLDSAEADALLNDDPKNSEVVKTILNGDDINNDPTLTGSRKIISFFDRTEAKAQEFGRCYEIVHATVRVSRATQKREHLRTKWWQYAEKRPNLYSSIANNQRVLVRTQASKHNVFEFVDNGLEYDQKLIVFSDERFESYAILNSDLHFAWVLKLSTDIGGTTLNYSPSSLFETFPFPNSHWTLDNRTLAEIGESYHEHRRQLMLDLWLGLTKIYNLFHDPELSVEIVHAANGRDEETARSGFAGLLELRRLHVEMDNAVRDAYGWQDLDLGHGFHEVETLPENDRTRYTISPTARKEVLKRLLALNHERAAEEEARAAAAKPVKKKAGKKSKADPATDGDNPLLSAGPLFE